MTKHRKSLGRSAVAFAIFTSFAPPTLSNGAPEWLPPVPGRLTRDQSWPLPNETFFEVPVSMFDAAADMLKDAASVPLTQPLTSWRRPDFSCRGEDRPCLVRALFGNGATGAYSLRWIGTELIVSHASLSRQPVQPRGSALVVCLPQAPTRVYSAISVAQ